jgi:hypothetical protein
MSKRFLPLLLVAGCAHSGMSESVRTDISMRMESARPTLTQCYANELKFDRKITGMMVLQFEAAPSTGQFQAITVVRDDMNNPDLQKCVVGAVETLKLATPQKSKLSITYPLDFAPTK